MVDLDADSSSELFSHVLVYFSCAFPHHLILTYIKSPKLSNAGMGVKRAKTKDMEQLGKETTMGDVGLAWKIMSNTASESRITVHSIIDCENTLQDGGIYK